MSDDRANEPEIDMTGNGKADEAKDAGRTQDAGPTGGDDGKPGRDKSSEAGAGSTTGSDGSEDGKSKKAGHEGDERAHGDAKYEQDRSKVFELYQEALKNADWAYKPKTGPERDIGHKSVVLAERGYVAAGLYDKAEADKMYESATGKPPKQELQQRLIDAKGEDPAKGIADLTAGMAQLDEKQKLWALTLDKNQIEKQMSNWEVAIGDASERKRNHQRAAAEELLKPERPGQGDDSGLDMFMRSLKGGFKAGKDWKMSSAHRAKERELGKNVSGSLTQHGELVKSIAAYTQEQGDGVGPTAGPAGKNVQRFAGVKNLVAAAMGRTKAKESGVDDVNAGGDGATKDAPKRGGIMDAMMRHQGQDQGR